MENFIYDRCTKVIFGKGTEEFVGEEAKKFGNNVLLHYGGGSIKQWGLYDRINKSLRKHGLKVVELGGVKPNPNYDLVYEGIKLCRDNSIDLILAVGGGSVIDSAKGIAVGVPYKGDVIDIAMNNVIPQSALPIGVILTIPAAGSETSQYAVITYYKGDYPMKRDVVWENHQIIRPKFAILNPELTYTLPVEQTAYGICDIMAHVMERYFTSTKHVELTDRLCEATLKTVINNARIVVKDPKNYDARAEIMWAGSIAQNDLLGTGRQIDAASHMIEHEISAIYDIPHGAGLAIIFPAWMKYVYKYNIDRFIQFSSRVWDIDYNDHSPELTILEAIKRLESFYKEIGLKTRLGEINIAEDRFDEISENTVKIGSIKKLDSKDVKKILLLAK